MYFEAWLSFPCQVLHFPWAVEGAAHQSPPGFSPTATDQQKLQGFASGMVTGKVMENIQLLCCTSQRVREFAEVTYCFA